MQALPFSPAAQAEFRAAARWEHLGPRPLPLSPRYLLPTPPTPLFGRAEALPIVGALLQRQEARLPRGCAHLALSIHARPSCSKYCFIIANVRRFSLRMGPTIIGRRSASTPDSRGVVVR